MPDRHRPPLRQLRRHVPVQLVPDRIGPDGLDHPARHHRGVAERDRAPWRRWATAGMVQACQANPGLHRLHRRQLPEQGHRGRPRLRRPQEQGRATTSCRPSRPSRPAAASFASIHSGQRGRVDDLRLGQDRVPDRQLRVRHRAGHPARVRPPPRRPKPSWPGPSTRPGATPRPTSTRSTSWRCRARW